MQFSSSLLMKVILCLLLLCGSRLVFAAPSTPTSDFVDRGDGTVTHKITGLIWKRCAEGQTWEDNNCIGTTILYTYDQAMKLVSNFALKNAWRLPSVDELEGIVERENNNPAINAEIFPNTLPTWFWSSSVNISAPYGAWNVSFFNGRNHFDLKPSKFAVRLVRVGVLDRR